MYKETLLKAMEGVVNKFLNTELNNRVTEYSMIGLMSHITRVFQEHECQDEKVDDMDKI